MKPVIRYFKQSIIQARNEDVEHLRNQAQKYLNSDLIDTETKVEIIRLFTDSEAGKKRITAERIKNPVVTITKWREYNNQPWEKVLRIDTDSLLVNKRQVRG